MRKTNAFFSFMLFTVLVGQLNAQSVKITWGPENKVGSSMAFNKLLGGDETGLYALFTQYRGFFIF